MQKLSDASEADNFWKHCDKRRNFSWCAISPFATIFSIILNCYTFILWRFYIMSKQTLTFILWRFYIMSKQTFATKFSIILNVNYFTFRDFPLFCLSRLLQLCCLLERVCSQRMFNSRCLKAFTGKKEKLMYLMSQNSKYMYHNSC